MVLLVIHVVSSKILMKVMKLKVNVEVKLQYL